MGRHRRKRLDVPPPRRDANAPAGDSQLARFTSYRWRNRWFDRKQHQRSVRPNDGPGYRTGCPIDTCVSWPDDSERCCESEDPQSRSKDLTHLSFKPRRLSQPLSVAQPQRTAVQFTSADSGMLRNDEVMTSAGVSRAVGRYLGRCGRGQIRASSPVAGGLHHLTRRFVGRVQRVVMRLCYDGACFWINEAQAKQFCG